jgi:hypothetical protein
MTVCIVHYNTPKLTWHCLCSLLKHHPAARVIIFDNSDLRPFSVGHGSAMTNVEILDNTRGQFIDFDAYLAQFPNKETGPINKSNYGSVKHALSVQWLIDHLDEPFLLMDSDVLIRQCIDRLCNPRYAFAGKVICNTRKRFGIEIYRAEPFLCYINTPMLCAHSVRYFNPDYMWALSHVTPNNRYDTGAWFLKDVQDHRLPYLDLDTTPYIVHFGHGSWHPHAYRQWLEEYRGLWQ